MVWTYFFSISTRKEFCKWYSSKWILIYLPIYIGNRDSIDPNFVPKFLLKVDEVKFLDSILAQLSFKFRSSNSSVYNCSDHAAIHAGNNTDFVQIKPTIIWNLIGMKLKLWISQILWLNFFCPILEHFCPLFVQIAEMGLILPRWPWDGVSFCPEYHHQCLFFTLPSQTPFWDMYEHETLPAPPQNTPFPGLNLKVDKMNCRLGKMDLICAKCLKSGQNFSRSGHKNIIHPDLGPQLVTTALAWEPVSWRSQPSK